MKKSLIILILSCWTVAAAFAQGGGYVDDLYRGSTRKSRQAEAQAAAEAQKRVRKQQTQQQMPVNWTPAQAASEASSAAVVEPSAGGDELVTSYDEALQRRLDAYKNYKEMDDSYWQLMESYHKMLEAKYDPELYNVITFGNEMWVEPVYISALFDGSDPAAGIRSKEFTAPSGGSVNISLNLGPGWWWDDPWDFGWYAPWNYPWRWGYYGWAGPYWGPSWRWGWNWTWGWRPSWSWGPADRDTTRRTGAEAGTARIMAGRLSGVTGGRVGARRRGTVPEAEAVPDVRGIRAGSVAMKTGPACLSTAAAGR